MYTKVQGYSWVSYIDFLPNRSYVFIYLLTYHRSISMHAPSFNLFRSSVNPISFIPNPFLLATPSIHPSNFNLYILALFFSQFFLSSSTLTFLLFQLQISLSLSLSQLYNKENVFSIWSIDKYRSRYLIALYYKFNNFMIKKTCSRYDQLINNYI